MGKKIVYFIFSCLLLIGTCLDSTFITISSKENNLPFTFEDTDYGVKSDLITANKLTITDDNTYVVTENFCTGKGILLLEKNPDTENTTFYLVGSEGLIIQFDSPDGSYPEIEGITVSPVDGFEKGNKVAPYKLYKIKNPKTKKYNIYNAIANIYYSYEADKIEYISGSDKLFYIQVGGKYGVLDGRSGKIMYEAIYDKIPDFNPLKKYMIAYKDEKVAFLTINGKSPGNAEYKSISNVSDNAKYAVAESIEGYKYWVLSGDTGEKLSDFSYNKVVVSDQGAVGERYISDNTSTVDIITEKGIINLGSNVYLGDFSFSLTFMDGKVLINDKKQSLLWYYDMSGKKIKGFERNSWVSYDYLGWYGDLIYIKNLKTRETYLEDLSGNKIINNIEDIKKIGKYILVKEKNVDNIHIIDLDTHEILYNLSNVENIVGKNLYCDNEKVGLLIKNNNLEYGIFNTETGKFSGFICKLEASTYEDLFEGKYINGEGIWYLPDINGGERFINENFEVIYNLPENAYFSSISNDLNIVTYDDSDILRVIDYQTGNPITDIKNVCIRDYNDKEIASRCEGFRILDSMSYGMVSKKGKTILEPKYSNLSESWYQLAIGVDQYDEEGKLVDINGNVLIEGELSPTVYFNKRISLEDGNIVLKGTDNYYYFYNLTKAAENGAQKEKIAITTTYPSFGSIDATSKNKDIMISFNQEIDIDRDRGGLISIRKYSNDEEILTYNMQTGSEVGKVLLANEKGHKTILLQNALINLKESEKYYVIIDEKCIKGVTKKPDEPIRWFEGINKKDTFSFTMIKDFVLGEDTNSFSHSENNFSSGYYINDEKLRNILIDELGLGMYKNITENNWNGSCYGIALTMALNLEGKLDYRNGVYRGDYVSLNPKNDYNFRNIINYYQLTQYISKPQITTYNKKSEIDDSQNLHDFLSLFVKELEEKKENETLLLTYQYHSGIKYGGHSILATDITKKENGNFEVLLYDENIIHNNDKNKAKFIPMNISKDFSSFSFKDGNGKIITNLSSNNANLISMSFSYPDNIYSLFSPSLRNKNKTNKSAESAENYIYFSVDENIKMKNDEGESLVITPEGVNNTKLSDDIFFITNSTIDEDGSLICRVPVKKEQNYTIEGMQKNDVLTIKNNGSYANLKGENIEDVYVNSNGSIDISGENLKFEISIADEIKSNVVFSMNVNAEENVKLKIENGNNLLITSKNSVHATKIETEDKNGNIIKKEDISGNNISIVHKPLNEMSFTDVPKDKWYYNTIKEAYNLGLVSGTTETTFSPNAPMNRGMVATVLHRMAGSPAVSYSEIFPDVAKGKYYSNAVTWAAKEKIISGYKDGRFGPGDNITRQDMAVILYNYASKNGADMSKVKDLETFKDGKTVSSYAQKAMKWAVGNGIISGTSDGKLNPKASATRAECTKMLLQTYKITK